MELQPRNWDLVIKVKYGNVLKRLNSFVRERRLDYSMTQLRLKIRDAFNLDQDAELALTYEDTDGDAIALERDEDLIDATINQQLNPLRIEVRLTALNADLVHRFKSMLMSNYSTSAASPLVQEFNTGRWIDSGKIGDINQSFCSDHRRCHASPQLCGHRPKKLKLKSRFVQDVTIPDGTRVSSSASFTKIWRIHNSGKDPWPNGTQLVLIGGDHMGSSCTVQLQIPPTGFPVQDTIDVQVDFVAPHKPGRYFSFWRLESPSGEKFGHFFWVLIEVVLPNLSVGNTTSLNLKLPQVNKYAGTGLLESDPPADQPMDHVAKQLDIFGCSQQFTKSPIDFNEDIQHINSTVDLDKDKERVFEWDQLLAELHNMGFCDEELNRKLLVEFGGSIKRVVLDLIARENML